MNLLRAIESKSFLSVEFQKFPYDNLQTDTCKKTNTKLDEVAKSNLNRKLNSRGQLGQQKGTRKE